MAVGCSARRLDDGVVKLGLQLNPRFTIKRFRAAASSDNTVYLAQRERIIEGMRVAGVPEGRPSQEGRSAPRCRLPSKPRSSH